MYIEQGNKPQPMIKKGITVMASLFDFAVDTPRQDGILEALGWFPGEGRRVCAALRALSMRSSENITSINVRPAYVGRSGARWLRLSVTSRGGEFSYRQIVFQMTYLIDDDGMQISRCQVACTSKNRDDGKWYRYELLPRGCANREFYPLIAQVLRGVAFHWGDYIWGVDDVETRGLTYKDVRDAGGYITARRCWHSRRDCLMEGARRIEQLHSEAAREAWANDFSDLTRWAEGYLPRPAEPLEDWERELLDLK